MNESPTQTVGNPATARSWLVWPIVGVWFVLSMDFYLIAGDAADLTAPYIAARLYELSAFDHIYAQDPTNFFEVGSRTWFMQGAAAGMGFDQQFYPYVYPPIWAKWLAPVATTVDFPTFNKAALALSLTAYAAACAMLHAFWSPKISLQAWMGLCLFGVTMTWPYHLAAVNTQPHFLILFLIALALLADDRDKPFLAGGALALATTIKVSPMFLAVYWIAKGRWRSLAWMTVVGIVILSFNMLTIEAELNWIFVDRLLEFSDYALPNVVNMGLEHLIVNVENALHGEPLLTKGDVIRQESSFSKATTKIVMLLLIMKAFLLARSGDEKLSKTAAPALIVGAFSFCGPVSWPYYYLFTNIALLTLPHFYGNRMGWTLILTVGFLTLWPLAAVFAIQNIDYKPWFYWSGVASILLMFSAFLLAPRHATISVADRQASPPSPGPDLPPAPSEL